MLLNEIQVPVSYSFHLKHFKLLFKVVSHYQCFIQFPAYIHFNQFGLLLLYSHTHTHTQNHILESPKSMSVLQQETHQLTYTRGHNQTARFFEDYSRGDRHPDCATYWASHPRVPDSTYSSTQPTQMLKRPCRRHISKSGDFQSRHF